MNTPQGFRQTTAEDLRIVAANLSAEAWRNLNAAMMTFNAWADIWMPRAHCWTSIRGGEVIAIGGFMSVAPGSYMSCLITTERVNDSPMHALRAARTMHQHLFDTGARRIATTGPGSATLEKWHRSLGYELEGVHPGGCANGDTAFSWGNMGVKYGR